MNRTTGGKPKATASEGNGQALKVAPKLGPAAQNSDVDHAMPAEADDAESALIGAILRWSERFGQVGDLRPEHFRKAAWRAVFRAMDQCHKEGVLPDLAAVLGRLDTVKPLHEKRPWREVLAEALTERSYFTNIGEYARHIMHAALARDIELEWMGLEVARRDPAVSQDGLIRRMADAAQRLRSRRPAGEVFERMTSKDLYESTDDQEYIIDGALPAGQPGAVGGVSKTLKTTAAIDAVISAATGKRFLGRFDVLNPCRAGIMSAESGKATLRETGIRVARAKGMDLRDVAGLIWSTSCPRLGDEEQLEHVERFVKDDELGALFIDPSYMALSDEGDGASNIFRMGRVLFGVSRIIQHTGCSIILIHHNRKNRPANQRQFDPPNLSDLTQSGMAEWARFWLLLGPRQEWDEETGRHWLWLRAGGSAGHSGLWAVDAFEGRRTDPGGRVWDVTVATAADARQEVQDRRRQDKQRGEADQLEADCRVIVETMRTIGAPETKTAIKDPSGLSGSRFGPAFSKLLRDRVIEHVGKVVAKGNSRAYDGYQLSREP